MAEATKSLKNADMPLAVDGASNLGGRRGALVGHSAVKSGKNPAHEGTTGVP